MANSIEDDLEIERRGALRALPWVFVSLFGVSAGLAILYVVMRALMQIGGSCASGGPYVSTRQCPDVVWLMPVGIVGGAFLGLVYIFTKPARAPSFVSLAWPALFLSLGWNFLDFGLSPPGRQGLDWGWLVCAIVFGLMGGVPLLALLLSSPHEYLRRVFWGVTDPLITPGVPAPPAAPPKPTGSVAARLARPQAVPPTSIAPSATPRAGASPEPPKADDIVAQLERLTRLHESGSLTDAEFEAAKQRVLAGGKRP